MGFAGSLIWRGLRRQKNDLRCLLGFFLGSVMRISLSRRQRSSNQAPDSTCSRCPALDENVVVSNTAGLLTQFRRKHLLHECLAAKVGDLGLGREEWIGAGRADRHLVLHLLGGLENSVAALRSEEHTSELQSLR